MTDEYPPAGGVFEDGIDAPTTTAVGEILAYEREVKAALRRQANIGGEPAIGDTPLSELLKAEDAMMTEDDVWNSRNEAMRRFFDFINQDGAEPWQVLKLLYALGAQMQIRPFCDLTRRDRELMFSDSVEARRWRMRQVVGPERQARAKRA